MTANAAIIPFDLILFMILVVEVLVLLVLVLVVDRHTIQITFSLYIGLIVLKNASRLTTKRLAEPKSP